MEGVVLWFERRRMRAHELQNFTRREDAEHPQEAFGRVEAFPTWPAVWIYGKKWNPIVIPPVLQIDRRNATRPVYKQKVYPRGVSQSLSASHEG